MPRWPDPAHPHEPAHCHDCGRVLDDQTDDVTYDDELDAYEHGACRAERIAELLGDEAEDWLESITVCPGCGGDGIDPCDRGERCPDCKGRTLRPR